MQAALTPLTPPPKELAFASKSSPWSIIWKMLGIVLLLYIITQSLAVAAIGLVDGDAFLTMFSLLCMTPFLAIFIYSRRPKLTHVIVATPDQNGNLQHNLPNFRVLNTPSPTRFTHHLIRDSPPLEMPKTSTLWIVFSLTIVFAALGLLPVMVSDNPAWLLLALFIGVPAWLLGFSLPVHAWWAFSTRHFQLVTTKLEGERMLIAGMLSTIPAIVINSLLFPLLLVAIGITSTDSGSLGEFLILSVSAPVGEEFCKALFVLSLYKLIDSPKRGFQIGFSVGLGFALLENLQYIMISLSGGAISYSFTAIVRGVGSIPGHAFWTGLSGVSIGWYLCSKRGIRQSESNNQNWMVFDSTTGEVVNTQNDLTKLGKTIRGWLYKPYDQIWNLPRNPLTGLSIAIAGHSLWNGSSWLVSTIFSGTEIWVQLIVNLAWILIMVGALWYVGREILASVMHLPHSIEFNDPSN